MSPLNRLRCFVLLGAALLFGVEPLSGRLVLAEYGGSFFVWATCLMVFQGILLLGYLYCHLLADRLQGKHLALLVVPVVLLPIAIHPSPNPSSPVGSLALDLVRGIGLPFLALATTGVVAQLWLAKSALPERSDPYLLYGASNLGSLSALLGYPLLIEPLLGLQVQRWVWSGSYVLYLLLAVWTWRGLRAGSNVPDTAVADPPAVTEAPAPADPPATTVEAPATTAPDPNAPVTPGLVVYWFMLAMVPSVFLLAVTNVISIDIGAMPLVWVLPLAIYLLSFVLVFAPRPRYPPILRRMWPELCTVGLMFFLLDHKAVSWYLAGASQLATLLVVAWVCHGELHASRPAPKHLSGFFLLVALGGWAGGLFVTLVAPKIFTSIGEYPLALGAMVLTLLIGRWSAFKAWWKRESWVLMAGSVILILACAWRVGRQAIQMQKTAPLITAHRNAYGQYRVRAPWAGEKVPLRRFYHGTTEHGRQALDPRYRRTAIGYYHKNSALGDVLASLPRPRKVAVVGLGAGVVASYFEAGETLDYFELDPDVETLARKHFTYLSDCPATVSVVHGDARVSLNRVPDGSYQAIVIDAFSSDAIPVHLLTREAIELYAKKLQPDGKALFHTSSRFYSLDQVLAATAPLAGMVGAIKTRNVRTELEAPTSYFLLMKTPDALSRFLFGRKEWQRNLEALPKVRPWTDDYANPLAVLTKFNTAH